MSRSKPYIPPSPMCNTCKHKRRSHLRQYSAGAYTVDPYGPCRFCDCQRYTYPPLKGTR